MKKVLAALLFLSLALSAFGQALTAEEMKKKEKAVQAEAVANVDAELSDPLRGATPALTFGLSEDKKTAKAQYGVVFDDNSWIVAISGPVGGDDSDTQLATQRGLNNFATGELDYKRTIWTQLPATTINLTKACKAASGKPSCVRNDLPEDKKPIFDAFLNWAPTWQWGLSASVGRKSFKFVDPNTLADGTESHQGSSVGASLGVFSSAVYFTRLSFDYATSYQAGKKATICKPVGTAGSRCGDAVVGAPTKKTQQLVQLEVRDFFGRGNYAVSPRVTYEVKDKVWSVELPVYMRTVGAFNGGISAGWDSEQHEVLFSVFVGALPSLMK
jgi:hypothetical protein